MGILPGNLLPASFRGVPFAVAATDEQFGRRVALHVYPGRDEPWAEDMGRAPRQFTLRGFIVADDPVYLGGPIALQRLAIIAAAELSGAGVLTHPTLGVLTVNCLRFSMGEDLFAGTASEVSFELVEAGKRSFPSLLTSSSGLFSAATVVTLAIAADFARAAIAATSAGGNRDDAIATGGALGAAVVEAAGDATSLTKLAALLPGNYGRYSAGANVGYAGSNSSSYAVDTTVAALAADAAANRQAVSQAADALASALETATDGTDAVTASAMNALVTALVGACADPADAIRLLLTLLDLSPPGLAPATDIGAAVVLVFRRSVVSALALAAASYQPASYDDAAQLLATIASVLDVQAVAAADVGDDASFAALTALRGSLVVELRNQGATVARIRTFELADTIPSLALAQLFYRDPTRADELVGEAAPRHPLFMPTSFQALAA